MTGGEGYRGEGEVEGERRAKGREGGDVMVWGEGGGGVDG